MATKPELNRAIAYEKIKANKWNENLDAILDYIEEVSEELTLKLNTVNSQLSSSILSNLQSVYPVGSLYIGVTETCPIASLFGTWEKVSEGRVLQGVSGSQEAGTTLEAGLPNITGTLNMGNNTGLGSATGAFDVSKAGRFSGAADGSGYKNSSFDASRSNSIYGNSDTVQPPAYLVNIWKRTA
jgi:hypothetical protein